MSFLDGRSQLLAGLRYFLATQIDESILPDNAIRDEAPDSRLVPSLGQTQDGKLLDVLVTIVLGRSVINLQLHNDVRTSVEDIAVDQMTAQTMTPISNQTVPVTFMVTAMGESRKRKALKAVAAIREKLGYVAYIPIPDSIPDSPQTPLVVDPSLTTFGITDRLVYIAEYDDEKLQAANIYRHDLTYNANYTEYTLEVDAVAKSAKITSIFY